MKQKPLCDSFLVSYPVASGLSLLFYWYFPSTLSFPTLILIFFLCRSTSMDNNGGRGTSLFFSSLKKTVDDQTGMKNEDRRQNFSTQVTGRRKSSVMSMQWNSRWSQNWERKGEGEKKGTAWQRGEEKVLVVMLCDCNFFVCIYYYCVLGQGQADMGKLDFCLER